MHFRDHSYHSLKVQKECSMQSYISRMRYCFTSIIIIVIVINIYYYY